MEIGLQKDANFEKLEFLDDIAVADEDFKSKASNFAPAKLVETAIATTEEGDDAVAKT